MWIQKESSTNKVASIIYPNQASACSIADALEESDRPLVERAVMEKEKT
jgi:hypothetical protein